MRKVHPLVEYVVVSGRTANSVLAEKQGRKVSEVFKYEDIRHHWTSPRRFLVRPGEHVYIIWQRYRKIESVPLLVRVDTEYLFVAFQKRVEDSFTTNNTRSTYQFIIVSQKLDNKLLREAKRPVDSGESYWISQEYKPDPRKQLRAVTGRWCTRLMRRKYGAYYRSDSTDVPLKDREHVYATHEWKIGDEVATIAVCVDDPDDWKRFEYWREMQTPSRPPTYSVPFPYIKEPTRFVVIKEREHRTMQAHTELVKWKLGNQIY